LQRTLGVPIFQEQVIKLATVAAGFTPGEADQLRRSMASWTRNGNLDQFQQRLIAGMRSRGYSEHYAQQIFQQIQGFGEYGFPESHSASFALLAYASAWLKCHEPAAFTCALLNSQPMGFYAPAQLVQDAQRHGVTVRAVDARVSDWDCTLERDDAGVLALRLGLRMAKGLSQAGAQHLCAARDARTFTDVPDLAQRAALSKKDLRALAAAGALAGLAGNRHQAHWQVQGVERPLPLLEAARSAEALPLLRPPTLGERIGADYVSLGLSLHGHPVALLRSQLQAQGALTAAQLRQRTHGATVRTAGLVITRQRPGSASGVIFLTLEDETGITNVVVWPKLAEREPAAVRHAPLVGVTGTLQRQGEVLHLVAAQLHDLSRDPRWPLDDHGTDGVMVRRNFK
jgi:error-prone DNA polymerase